MSRSDFVRASAADLLTTLCVAGMWCGIWLLWPRGRAGAEPPGARKVEPAASTRFILRSAGSMAGTWSPTLVALPSESGFSHLLASDVAEDAGRTLTAVRPDPAALLDRSLRSPGPQAVQPEELEGWPVRPVERYAPVPVERPVFSEPADRPAVVAVLPSRVLLDANFSAGAPPAGWPDAKEPWAVNASVDFGADGGALHVFLVQPVSNETVNAAATEALRLSRVRAGGRPVSGTVALSWPGKKQAVAAGAAPGTERPASK